MNRARSILLAISVLGVSSGTDGVWTLREHFCLKVDRKKQCGPGTEDLLFLAGTAYFRTDPSDDWDVIGTVGTTGRRVVIDVGREGFGRLVAAKTGVEVTEYLTTFALVYRAVQRGDKLAKGRVRADATLDVEGTPHSLHLRGTFTGRRTGDASLPQPNEPEIARAPAATTSVLPALSSAVARPG